MGLFIANQTGEGGEVQLSVREWDIAGKLILLKPRNQDLGRRILQQISGNDHDAVIRIRLSNAEIDRVDAVLQGR